MPPALFPLGYCLDRVSLLGQPRTYASTLVGVTVWTTTPGLFVEMEVSFFDEAGLKPQSFHLCLPSSEIFLVLHTSIKLHIKTSTLFSNTNNIYQRPGHIIRVWEVTIGKKTKKRGASKGVSWNLINGVRVADYEL
jgi:hypothetical protein